MGNYKLVFSGTNRSETENQELTCFCNTLQEIYIEIKDTYSDHCYNLQTICLDKHTAIKLHRELKKQISFIKEEVQNG